MNYGWHRAGKMELKARNDVMLFMYHDNTIIITDVHVQIPLTGYVGLI